MAEIHATPADSQRLAAACSVRQLERVFGNKGNITYALNGISFDIEEGEFVAIMGPSGSGKTTLLNCMATIDRPTSGAVYIGGRDATSLRGHELSRFRREDLGFIFQDSNLLDTLTGFENIVLPLSIRGEGDAMAQIHVREVAATLDITDVLDKFPAQMSGGQRQRVAAARAIVGNPKIVLADEPTGALDSRNAQVMLETLAGINRGMNTTILMVTHDAFAASWASRVLFVKDGRLFTELRRGSDDRKPFYDGIIEVQAFLGGDSSHVG